MHAHISISIILCLSTDIDECANDSSDVSDDGSAEGSQNVCNQICTNTNGSFYCECFHGYQLSDDFMTCVGMWIQFSQPLFAWLAHFDIIISSNFQNNYAVMGYEFTRLMD